MSPAQLLFILIVVLVLRLIHVSKEFTMRASAPLVVWAVAVALGGCCVGSRPDAEVAMTVERAERLRLELTEMTELTMLASADEALPVALPVPIGAEARPDGAETAPAGGTVATAVEIAPSGRANDRLFADWSKETFQFSAAVPPPSRFFEDDPEANRNRRSSEGKKGLSNLKFELFRLTVNGRPVDLKCSIKNKHLMFGMKIIL